MPSKLNIGIIGAGMIGDVHVKTIRVDGRGEVIRLADPNLNILDQKRIQHGISKGSGDYRELLQDPDVEAVIIASPPFTHFEIALAALDAGKHLLIEKPMCIHPDEVDPLLRAVKAHSKQVVVECSCRHARLQPKFREVKKWIEEGRIGDVYHLHHLHHSHLMRRTFIEWNPAGAWSLDRNKAGAGPFLDQGVYDLSFHLGILNDEPGLKAIRSFTRGGLKVFKDASFRQDVEEHGAAYMEFDTGLTYYYERGSGAQCEVANETRIHGTQGSLRFGFNSWDAPQADWFFADRNGNEKNEALPFDMSGHTDDSQELTKHFLDCIADGARPMMTAELAAKHLDILFRILGKTA